ncbi:MAG: hypothetical protein WB424_16255, partial [Terracidiphilus sp.]
ALRRRMYPSITLTMSACCLTVWEKSITDAYIEDKAGASGGALQIAHAGGLATNRDAGTLNPLSWEP